MWGQEAGLGMLKWVIHIVTTGPYKVMLLFMIYDVCEEIPTHKPQQKD
jgi:hypothetical protein